MFELARRAALSNVGVICTQSDVSVLNAMSCSTLLTPQKDIRPNEARQDWPSERTRITILEKAIADQRQVIAALDEDIRGFIEEPPISTEDAQEFCEIQQQHDKAM